MWPQVRFDPIKLFDLKLSDLLIQDPYFVRLCMQGHEEMGVDFFIGLQNAPDVVGYFGEVCPDREEWLRDSVDRLPSQLEETIRRAERKVLEASCPWNLGMAKSPETWDALPWSYWDPSAIYDHVDLYGKIVLDAGAGTGQVTIRCAPYASLVYALEPVARLRRYIERKLGAAGFNNIRTIDGLLELIPLPDSSVDAAIISNGSFGWNPRRELSELERVKRPGGTIEYLCVSRRGLKEGFPIQQKTREILSIAPDRHCSVSEEVKRASVL